MVKLSTEDFVIRTFNLCFNDFIAYSDDIKKMGTFKTGGLKEFPIIYEHVFRRPASDLEMFRTTLFRKMQSEDLSNLENLKKDMDELYEVYRDVAGYKALPTELKSRLEKEFFKPAKKFFKELDSRAHTKYFSKKVGGIKILTRMVGDEEFFERYAPSATKFKADREEEKERGPTPQELSRYQKDKLAILEKARSRGDIDKEGFREEKQTILEEIKKIERKPPMVLPKYAKEFVKSPYFEPERELEKAVPESQPTPAHPREKAPVPDKTERPSLWKRIKNLFRK
jgi:hypothetical protein